MSGESRELLIEADEWLACEVSEVPPPQGQMVIGIDLGGSASMSGAAFYWPDTGRLECLGTFPAKPSLLDRGQNDGVSGRYVEMHNRGELTVLGDATLPVAPRMRWKAMRMQALERDGWACVQCGQRRGLEVDHVQAVKTHPELSFSLGNLQCLCGKCHSRKTRIEIGLGQIDRKREAWKKLVKDLQKPNEHKEHTDA